MFLEFYQNLPQHINPIVFLIGFFQVRWYSLAWLMGIMVFYILLHREVCENKGRNYELRIKNYELQNLFFYLFLGVLLGGRLGYVVFYNFSYYLHNPLKIFLPFELTAYSLQLTGFFGMSYFGALIGAVSAGYIFSKKYKINFWKLADFVSVAVSAGYFFGRIGNFLNGELYGRITNVSWGMHFDSTLFLRHPSQLYEAFFEGAVLFVILILLRNRLRSRYFPGILFLAYIFGYSFFRFFLEFFREPDPQLGLIFGYFSLGQVFSFVGILISVFWMIFGNRVSKDSKNLD